MLEWVDKQNGVDDILAEDINSLAHAIKDLEKKDVNIVVDGAMSDTSTNPVQNNVVKTYVDSAISSAIGEALEGDY